MQILLCMATTHLCPVPQQSTCWVAHHYLMGENKQIVNYCCCFCVNPRKTSDHFCGSQWGSK